MNSATQSAPSGIGYLLNRISVLFAYVGGVVVAAIGIMSAVSIIGRATMSKPITGDFELVEIGTAIAGTLFLPYCQATGGHIVVDLFTLKASERTRDWLDRFGSLLMAAMFLVVSWRAGIGSFGLKGTGESSMLLGFPTWIGYAGIVPGSFLAGVIALAQSLGINVMSQAPDTSAPGSGT